MTFGGNLEIPTTLSMIMTFVMDCTLRDTRASGFFFQDLLVDRTRDQLLYLRCLWNNESVNKTCQYFYIHDDKYNIYVLYPIIIMQMTQMSCLGLQKISFYVRPFIATITIGWLLARFFDALDLWCQVDMFVVYFIIWQFMCVIAKWELDEVPFFSFTVHRVWLWMSMVFGAFIGHNAVFRYLSPKIKFFFFWMLAAEDMLACLHPQMLRYNTGPIKLSDSKIPDLHGVYYSWNLEDDKLDEKIPIVCLGLGDFYVFNLMLLSVIPSLSSMTIKICVTIGYIIVVQIGQEGTILFRCIFNQLQQPALPFPIVAVLMYSFLLNIFIEY